MANFNSDIANTPARAPRFGSVIGRRAKIQTPTGLVAADTLSMFKLPKGAVVLDGFLLNDDAGTTVTGDVGLIGGTIDGVAEDPNAYVAAAALGTPGKIPFTAVAGLIDAGPVDAERMLAITLSAVTGLTVGADIVCVAYYMLSA